MPAFNRNYRSNSSSAIEGDPRAPSLGLLQWLLRMSETRAAFTFCFTTLNTIFIFTVASWFKMTAGALVITHVLWGRRGKSKRRISPAPPQPSQLCFRILPRRTHTSSHLSLATTVSHCHTLSKGGREVCFLSQIVVCPAKQLGLISVGEEENGFWVTTSRFC